MLNAIFRPIADWPGKRTPAHSRRSNPFDSTYLQTLDLLERELNHLGAQNIVVQAEVEMGQVRNDGWLKSNATVRGPGVIVSFTRGRNSDEYSYPCDTFTHWQVNIRAIALALEALRKIDRYGITAAGQQYQGFKRLAAPDTNSGRAAAIAQLSILSEMPLGESPDEETITAAYRSAAKRVHPDTGGRNGDASGWERLQAAMQVLKSQGAM